MDLKTLEDLLALIETGSLSEAAARRYVSQPAFSRRVKAIELSLGSPVIDRSTRPIRPTAWLQTNAIELREMTYALRRLHNDLRGPQDPTRVLSFACLHAIAMAIMPPVLERLATRLPYSHTDLRAANVDECFAWLMTGQVSMMLTYETNSHYSRHSQSLVEKVRLCEDPLIPVSSLKYLQAVSSSPHESIALIDYPDDSVLGRIVQDELLPQCNRRFYRAVTSAFSTAVMCLITRGMGVGWVPQSMAQKSLDDGELVLVDSGLKMPTASMYVTLLRQRNPESGFLRSAWDTVREILRDPK